MWKIPVLLQQTSNSRVCDLPNPLERKKVIKKHPRDHIPWNKERNYWRNGKGYLNRNILKGFRGGNAAKRSVEVKQRTFPLPHMQGRYSFQTLHRDFLWEVIKMFRITERKKSLEIRGTRKDLAINHGDDQMLPSATSIETDVKNIILWELRNAEAGAPHTNDYTHAIQRCRCVQ